MTDHSSPSSPLFAMSHPAGPAPLAVPRFGRYVGRVGALAAAFGIGMAVMASAGTAAAEPSSSASSSSDSQSAGDSSAKSPGSTANSSSSPTGGETEDSNARSGKASSEREESADDIDAANIGGEPDAEDADEPTDAELPERPEAEAPAAITEPVLPPEPSGISETKPDPDALPSMPIAPSGEAQPAADRPSRASHASKADSAATADVEAPTQGSEVEGASSPNTEVSIASASRDSRGDAVDAQTMSVAISPVVPNVNAAPPITGFVGLLNSVVTNLLNPFLAPAPSTGDPVTPVLWAVLGWVRRNLFNQAPTIAHNPTMSVQTGQTVAGNIGATDLENDALTYTVTKGPKYGVLTIDQATGNFTYTPDDINYTAAQYDSFTVSVSDGKFSLLAPFRPHRDKDSLDVTTLNPLVERVIVSLPENITAPMLPRFTGEGDRIYFSAIPAGQSRREVYLADVDGTGITCVTCGVSTDLVTGGLYRPLPFQDGSGRIMIAASTQPGSTWIYEETAEGKRLVPVKTPLSAGFAIDPQREPRISPDGKHLLFSQIQVGQGGYVGIVPVVGKLTRTTNATTGAPEYRIDDARAVYPVGEGKQWTPDGKGVVILGGDYEAGNVDDVIVDLATGEITRLTASLDYDEDMDLSPNQTWIAIGSTRSFDALTPMTRIVRPSFLPSYVVAAVYGAYATPINISNQEWLVAIEDELKRENGIPLFDFNDGYTARSMPSWNPTGDKVAFWEYDITDPSVTRMVIANLKYTTSVGPVAGDRSTPDPTWAPKLTDYAVAPPPKPPLGTYHGSGGGTAVVTERDDPNQPGHKIRTVVYSDYINAEGMVLNGTEWTNTTASQSSIYYFADIIVSGAHTGSLKADATISVFEQRVIGSVVSVLDGQELKLLDPDRIAESIANT